MIYALSPEPRRRTLESVVLEAIAEQTRVIVAEEAEMAAKRTKERVMMMVERVVAKVRSEMIVETGVHDFRVLVTFKDGKEGV